MTSRQWAALISLSLGCSVSRGAATPPAPPPKQALQVAPAQNIAKPEDVIATDAQLMVSDRLANCLRSDATVLTNGDGSKTLRFIFFAKQSTGYCGCKSPLVKYVVSYGKPGNPPAGASHRFSGEVDSMTATEQETKLMVPLPASPNNAYGLELGCAN